jgi:hypothetical protein
VVSQPKPPTAAKVHESAERERALLADVERLRSEIYASIGRAATRSSLNGRA